MTAARLHLRLALALALTLPGGSMPMPAGASSPAYEKDMNASGSKLPMTSALAGAVDLDAVLESVDRHYPLLAAARTERGVREAKLRESRGAFDTRLGLEGGGRAAGFYDGRGAGATIEQNTTLWGLRLKAGYRYGDGKYPSYEGDRLTDSRGELSGGLVLPLLRGGAIDEARAGIRRSELSAEGVTPEIELEAIMIRRDASRAYWDWVAAGLALQVAEQLLHFAVDRQTQIEGRVKRGAEPEIDLVDNERLIVDRRMRLRAAEREFEQASLTLSLFHRDEYGTPVARGRDGLPASFPGETPLDPAQVRADLEHARLNHPLVKTLEIERERWQVELELARNDLLPNVDLELSASKDFGSASPGIDTSGRLSGSPRSETEVKALIRIELPVQRRKAKGRRAVSRLRTQQVEQRLRFERERIGARLEQAVAGLDAAWEQTLHARRNLELAEQLQRAEKRKFSLGLSNLIDVNIRELQVAAAALSLIETQAAFFVARADYEAAAARPESWTRWNDRNDSSS